MLPSEIFAFTSSFRTAFLRGTSSDRMCAALSSPLNAALNMLGIASTLYSSDLAEGVAHIFIMLPDGQVLDPTADQLPGFDPVYLGRACGIYRDRQPWAGGAEWLELMAQFMRLHPAFSAAVIGRMAGDVLRSMPPGYIQFSTP